MASLRDPVTDVCEVKEFGHAQIVVVGGGPELSAQAPTLPS